MVGWLVGYEVFGYWLVDLESGGTGTALYPLLGNSTFKPRSYKLLDIIYN